MLNFTAIDFETANSNWSSPCAVGVVKVHDGQIVHQESIYMRPPESRDYFDQRNIEIHGITPERVADAPRWREVLPSLVGLIGDDLLIAHNAAFDTGVVRHSCDVDSIDTPNLEFLCTLVMSRRALDLPAYKLPSVAAALGVPLGAHHDPLADAQAAAGIAMALARRTGAPDLHTLASHCQVRIGSIGTGTYRGCVHSHSSHSSHACTREASEVPCPKVDANPDGPLYGRSVVFSCGLASMSRNQAWQACADVGAIPQKGVTMATNLLVVGGQGPAARRPGAKSHSKEVKALALQRDGQDIQVVSEDEFLRLLKP